MGDVRERDGTDNLISLNELKGFHLSDGEPDPRGWKVIGADGDRIGEVEELIVDRDTRSVRYLDCSLEEERLGLDTRGRHVLFPVEPVGIDREEKRVLLNRTSSADVARMPTFTGHWSRDYLNEMRTHDSRRGEIDSEEVVERRPFVEEVVVRRRVVDSGDTDETIR